MKNSLAYQDDCDLLREGVKHAAKVALSYFGSDVKQWSKAGNSPVSEADLAVDQALREYYVKARPSYGWISEESAPQKPKAGEARSFVIDPIDGTRGFLRKSAIWCIAVAIIEHNTAKAGVIYAPILDELFYAFLGGGAYLNGRLLKKTTVLEKSSFTISAPESFIQTLPQFWPERLIIKERLPSLAYCLTLFAKNELDFLLTSKNCYDWDIAAADILLREAGQDLLDIEEEKIRYNSQQEYKQNYLCLAPKDQQARFAVLAKKYYNLS